MSASDAVSASNPSSVADTKTSSRLALVVLTEKAGLARTSAAEAPIPQRALSNAFTRARVFANVPTAMVFHAETSAADLIGAFVAVVEGAFPSRFCRTSRTEH